jgi:hypothetical protein
MAAKAESGKNYFKSFLKKRIEEEVDLLPLPKPLMGPPTMPQKGPPDVR